jgi:predicted O-linked N-acetylglucosamine transferase (SPINDLY family)
VADILQAFAAAVVRHQAGDLAAAEAMYRDVLRRDPGHPPTLCNLGALLAKLDRFEEAGRCYAQCLAVSPGYPDAHYNFGNLYRRVGRLREAAAEYEACLRGSPDHASALFNLGLVQAAQQDVPAATDSFRRAISADPEYADAYARLGDALLRSGQLAGAVEQFRRYATLRPADHRGWNNLGLALANAGHPGDAVGHLQKALELKPDYPDAHNTLGLAYEALGRKDEAIHHYREAVRLNPEFADAWSNLGTSLTEQGRADEAITALQRSLAVRPNAAPVHSNLLLTLNYSSSYTPAEVATEHRRWATIFGGGPVAPPVPADPDPDRPLRVGYLSGDFRAHTVAGFIEILLAHHDRDRFHVTGYPTAPRTDDVTAKLERLADRFHPLVGLSDEQAAARIRADGIDLLIDLSGHTASNRLLVLARRPAPVQATLFGYPNTTGLAAVDYRITDAVADPPGETEHLYSEDLLRLSGLAWAYQPPTDAPPVTPLPSLSRSTITFGCLNNAAKLSDACLDTWARLLAELPNARLVLLAGTSEGGVKRITDRFAAAGVDRGRLELVARLPRDEYFQAYQLFDIALDPFPYNGGVTTCDALWMGVPVLAVAGGSYVARQGASVMTHAGLSEFVADSPDRLIELAKTWADNREWLAEIRAGLRVQVARSVGDGRRYVRSLEAALRQAWQDRVSGGAAASMG